MHIQRVLLVCSNKILCLLGLSHLAETTVPANNACNSLIIDVEKPVKDEIGVELYIERIASLVGRTVNRGQQ